MSTANKLTYLNVTKQKLKQAINNIGGEVTDETTFREYVAELENAYDRLPKTEFEEGESVTLENTLKGKLDFQDGKVGFGQASQETTNGYQLYLLPPSKTLNGITYTNNGDGTCDIVGTATAQCDFALATRIPLASSPISLGSACNISVEEAIPGVTFQVVEYNSGGTWIATQGLLQNTQSQNITISDNSNIAYIDYNIRVYNGSTVNAKGIKLMMNTGTSRKDFEQYSGGYSSPSPNWEQEIKCVAGKNIVESKNVKSTTTGYSDVLFTQADLKPHTTYTISFEGVAGNKIYANENLFILEYMTIPTGRASLVVTTKATISKNTRAQYQEENGGWLIFKNNGDGNPTANVFDNLQIEEGNEATPYLPYNTIEEVVSGKNLLDIYNTYQAGYSVTTKGITFTWNDDGSISISGTSTSENAYVDIYTSTTKLIGKPGERIVYCLLENTSNDVVCHIYDYADGTYKNNNAGTIIAGHTNLSNATGSLIRIIIPSNNVTVNVKVYPIIATGAYTWDNLPTYEPYITPTSYQLSLGDIELNAIGNYKDELIYDVENDKVYKNEKIKEYVLSDLFWAYNSSPSTPVPRTTIRTIGITESVDNFLSNIFDKDAEQPNTIKKYDNVTTYISMADSITGITSGDTDTQKLQKMLAVFTNKNANLLVIKTTPTLTEITDTTLKAQVKAWYYGQSLNGTTIITSNGNLPMVIKVRGLKGE